ncbi:hypothetical protein NBRC116590_03580 [Pelagimonas sp. KU-00592-HH]
MIAKIRMRGKNWPIASIVECPFVGGADPRKVAGNLWGIGLGCKARKAVLVALSPQFHNKPDAPAYDL